MKNGKIVVTVVAIVIFCCVTLGGISLEKLVNFIDSVSIMFVLVGGTALAAAKIPHDMKEFLRYFSKTSLLAGALGTAIGGINMLKGIDFTYSGPLTWGSDLSVMLLTMFYGILFSAIAYALYRGESDGK